MLATVLNALALQDALERTAPTRACCRPRGLEVAEPYIGARDAAPEKGRIVIFAAAPGNPFFTTDTAARYGRSRSGAEAILMGKNGTKGVYDGDPRTDPDAPFLPTLTHLEAIERGSA
jgi:uridylate kinase